MNHEHFESAVPWVSRVIIDAVSEGVFLAASPRHGLVVLPDGKPTPEWWSWADVARYKMRMKGADPIPFWPAVVGGNFHAGLTAHYSLTTSLYPSEEHARKDWTETFVRLAKELPPVMLEARP